MNRDHHQNFKNHSLNHVNFWSSNGQNDNFDSYTNNSRQNSVNQSLIFSTYQQNNNNNNNYNYLKPNDEEKTRQILQQENQI